jgi:hypothetical protein
MQFASNGNCTYPTTASWTMIVTSKSQGGTDFCRKKGSRGEATFFRLRKTDRIRWFGWLRETEVLPELLHSVRSVPFI